MARVKDLTGKQFGSLIVLQRCERPKTVKSGTNAYWLCKCICGSEKKVVVTSTKLTSGHTKSCGCYQKLMASKSNSTHRLTKTHLYTIWQAMKRRCYDPKNSRFHVYGGKGIKVFDEWLDDYMIFREWATNNGYRKELSIDRIDVDGDYEPSNCRWVTMKKQQNNRSNNKLLEYEGKTHTLAEWSDITGLSIQVLHSRLNKLNWSVEKTLTTPLRSTKRYNDKK